MPPTATLNSVPCSNCSYPVQAPTYVGQQVKCSYCSSINEAITQVTIPTPVFVGVVCFAAGVLLGPAFWVSTKAGSEWLAKRARERIK